MEDEKHPFIEPTKNGISKSCKAAIVIAIAVPSILFLAAVGGIIGLVINGGLSMKSESTSVCSSPSCVELASTVLLNMDKTIDPCDDFYNYSCGGWESRNIIPAGYGAWGVFQELDQQNHIYLEKLITSSVDNSILAINLTRQLYSSCMNIDGLDEHGSTPIIDLLNKTGGWDLVGVHNGSSPKWSLGSANYLSSVAYGNGAFLGFGITVNDKNSSQYIAALSQSGLTLPSKDSYLNADQINITIPALHQYIVSTLLLLDPSADKTSLDEAAEQIVDLETELAKIFVSNVELRNIDASYNPYMLRGNLSNSSFWEQLNWTDFVTNTFASAGVSIEDDLIIIVKTPSYFTNLTEVYSKFNDTVHENYFKWQLVKRYVPYLGSEFLVNYYTFTSAVVGSGMIERYLTCLSLLEDLAPLSVSRLYTDYVMPNGTVGNVTVMVANIKSAFEQRLQENKWLDDETREKSKWKVGNITAMIAHPDGIYNETVLSEETKVVEEAKGHLFMTISLYRLRENNENLQQLGKPVDKTEWELAPTMVNAYYEPLYNQFVFLQGILNKPFFDAAWPDYFNYGAFGVVIGHELTHGFDDQGQRYNQHGILTPWWTKASIAEFNRRKACFVEQYSKYSVFGFPVNGNLTLGENIADNGGVKTAFQAYKNVIIGKTPPSLPGVDLSPDELFFVAFGQVWCSLFNPRFIQSNLQTNPHSPGPLRVIGALSNSEDFAEVFKCRSGSRMNPEKKCDLW